MLPFKFEALHAGTKVDVQRVDHMLRVALADLRPSVHHPDIRQRKIFGLLCLSEHILFQKDEVPVCQDQFIVVEHGEDMRPSAIADLADSENYFFFRTEFEFFCHI